MTTALDSVALAELVRVCRQLGEHTTTNRFALGAYIHAMIAQAQAQVVFDVLTEKNLIGSAELTRRISERLKEQAERLESTGLVLNGVPTKLVLS